MNERLQMDQFGTSRSESRSSDSNNSSSHSNSSILSPAAQSARCVVRNVLAAVRGAALRHGAAHRRSVPPRVHLTELSVSNRVCLLTHQPSTGRRCDPPGPRQQSCCSASEDPISGGEDQRSTAPMFSSCRLSAVRLSSPTSHRL